MRCGNTNEADTGVAFFAIHLFVFKRWSAQGLDFLIGRQISGLFNFQIIAATRGARSDRRPDQ